MAATFYPKARTENLIIQDVADETLVYDLTTHKAHCLNETAAFVWSSCSGDASVEDMARLAEARFGRPVDVDLVNLALVQLNERRLLSESVITGPVLPSRRQAIKRIGLASAIALPVIASLVAPPAVQAGLSDCVCVVPGDCAAHLGCPSIINCNGSGMCAP